MTRVIKYLVLLVLVVCVAWWYFCNKDQSQSSTDTQIADMEPLIDRFWIDHMPKDERDKVDLFVMVSEPSVGGFSTSSAYEGDWSAFEWTIEKGLRIHMLQSDKDHKIKAVIIKGDGCKPFDYCLKLKGAPRGSKRYGSMEDWVINSGETPDPRALVRGLLLE
jgi:hypothetical protein